MTTLWIVSALVVGLVVGCAVGFVVRRRSDGWCRGCGAAIGHHCADCVQRRHARAAVRNQRIEMAAYPV